MPVWKKVIVSGSAADLASVTASGYRVTGSAFQQFLGAPNTTGGTIITGSFSGSFTGTITANVTSATSASFLQIGDSTANTATQYVTFVGATSGFASQSIDTNLSYVPNTDTLSLGNIAVNSGSITTNIANTTATVFNTNATALNMGGGATAVTIGATPTSTITLRGGTLVGSETTQNVFNTTATTINMGGAATQMNFGAANGTSSFAGTVVINGGLDINGTVTTIDTVNLLVADQYILLGSGSVANKPGGFVVQSAAASNSGFALIYDSTTDRWYTQDAASAATGLGAISTSTTMAVVGVQNGSAATRPADGTGPIYGGTANGYGAMWIDTDGANDIWIYV